MRPIKYFRHFSEKDNRIADLIQKHGAYTIPEYHDYYEALVKSIIGQQVSTKAAQSVYQKLLSRYQNQLEPLVLSQASREELREVGISRQKHSYIVDLSLNFLDETETFEHLHTLDDESVIKTLTKVKGIGVWTAQMFLMFTLGRLDVFPVDDLGIRTAMSKVYGMERDETKKNVFIHISKKWSPYKSVACWYLWKSLTS